MKIFERWYFGLCWNLRLVTDKINYYLPHMCTLNPNHRDDIFRVQWRRDESLPLNYFPALFFGLKCSPGFTLSHELEHPGKIIGASSSIHSRGRMAPKALPYMKNTLPFVRAHETNVKNQRKNKPRKLGAFLKTKIPAWQKGGVIFY